MSKIQPFTFANLSLLIFNGWHHSALSSKSQNEMVCVEGTAWHCNGRPCGGIIMPVGNSRAGHQPGD